MAGLREVPAVCKSYMYIVELGLQQVLGLFPQAPNLHLWQMLVMIISNIDVSGETVAWLVYIQNLYLRDNSVNTHFTYLRDLDIRIVRVSSRGCCQHLHYQRIVSVGSHPVEGMQQKTSYTFPP